MGGIPNSHVRQQPRNSEAQCTQLPHNTGALKRVLTGIPATRHNHAVNPSLRPQAIAEYEAAASNTQASHDVTCQIVLNVPTHRCLALERTQRQ